MKKSLIISIIAIIFALVALVFALMPNNGKDGLNGIDGKDGTDGLTPTIEISNDGYWVINGEKTNILADDKENPQGLEFFLQDDGTYAVAAGRAKYLSKVIIPETYKGGKVVAIADEGFLRSPNLTSITIPDSITSIGEYAFVNCSSLTRVTLGSSVTNIAYGAFMSCTSLLEICNKSSLNIVAGQVEHGYIGLYAKSIITDESQSTIKYVGDFVFFDNGTQVELVTYLGNDQNITLPDYNNGTKYEIGSDFLSNNATVTSVTIPNSITKIGYSAFYKCDNLSSITYKGTVDEWNDITKLSNPFEECPAGNINCNDGTISVCIDITLWVSSTQGISQATQYLIQQFKNIHPEYSFNFTIETVAEGDVTSLVLADISSAADIYCFPQNELSRLANAGALSPLYTNAANAVRNNNDSSSVAASSINSTIYAYPLTNDNGYFLYYDSRYVSDEDAQTLEGIIEACQRSGKRFGYELSNGWMSAGFFFSKAIGSGKQLCTSEWIYSADFRYPIAINDNINSDNGIIAMKAMHMLATSDVWNDNSNDFSDTAAMVTGLWNSQRAEYAYGEYVKATKLPTFTIDGQEYQMGSFSGFKMYGCKPQNDSTKAKICSDLALWLSGEQAQLELYYEAGWGPSNINAQQNEDVANNIFLNALLQQNAYSQIQGTIPDDWWYEMYILSDTATDYYASTSDFKVALENYHNNINEIIVR